jgi:hypothetical protein
MRLGIRMAGERLEVVVQLGQNYFKHVIVSQLATRE